METATKQAAKVSIALNVAPSGATIVSQLITSQVAQAHYESREQHYPT